MALSYFHVTPAGAGTKDGSTWGNAMGLGEFETSIEGSASPEYVYFIAGGTYTLSSTINSNAKAGTAASPISLIGVNSSTTNVGSNLKF